MTIAHRTNPLSRFHIRVKLSRYLMYRVDECVCGVNMCMHTQVPHVALLVALSFSFCVVSALCVCVCGLCVCVCVCVCVCLSACVRAECWWYIGMPS